MEDRIRKIIREVIGEVLGETDRSVPTAPKNPASGPPSGPRILVVYHTGMERLEEALEQAARIEAAAGKAAFWQGPEARELMCPADLKDKTGARCSLNTVGGEGLAKVLDLAEVVVLPTLSLKVAARVVRLTVDCPGSELVLKALLKGKKVIAANDGFITPGVDLNPALSAEIERVFTALAGYGAILCPTAELARTYLALTASSRAKSGDSPQGPEPEPKNLITARDINAAANGGGGRVVLARGGLVTPLARDMAKEYMVEIITEIE